MNSDIRSTAGLLSIAAVAERETIRCYAEIAALMNAYGNSATGAVFERLVAEEQVQEQRLHKWARLAGLAIDLAIEPLAWDDPGVATVYDTEAKDPQLATPYKALAFAVHNAERGFRFYSYIAAHSKNPDVCDYAEILAREELAHAALLRVRRRRAWHAQRSRADAEPHIDAATIHATSDLLAATISTERPIAALLEIVGKEYPALQALVHSTREFISSKEKALQENELPGSELAAALLAITHWRESAALHPETSADALQRLLGLCDRSFTLYDSVVAATDDESVMLQAQHHSELALQRVADLRRLTAVDG